MKSEDTILIEEMARPYRAFVPITQEALTDLMEGYWAENAQNIIKLTGYKGKKGKGGLVDLEKARKAIESTHGVSKIYREAFSKYALGAVQGDIGKDILLLTGLSLEEGRIIVTFFVYPELIFNGEINYDLTSIITRTVDEEFDARCKDLQYNHREFTSTDGVKPDDQDLVVVDIICNIGDKGYEEGTKRLIKVAVEELPVPEIRQAVKESVKGDLVELTYSLPAGEVVSAQVKIHDVQKVSFLSTESDDLYKLEGFEGKEAFRATFESQYHEYCANAEKYQAFEYILNQLIEKSIMEPIPDQYLEMAGHNLITRHSASMGSKEAAMRSVGAKTESEMIRIMQVEALRSLVQKMAVNKYISIHGLKKDTTYPEIVEHMHLHINWK